MSTKPESASESASESAPESTQEIPKPTCTTCGKSKAPVQEESIKKIYWIVGSLSSFILILCIIFALLMLRKKDD